MAAHDQGSFAGFAPGPVVMTGLPSTFFTELLPLVDDLAELKVLLFCFYALPQREGEFRYLRRQDFVADPALMRGLVATQPDVDAHDALDAALEGAVKRGSLLRAQVRLKGKEETLYFVNTVRGRDAVAQIAAGQFRSRDDTRQPVDILPPRPTIYRLYEENIGALTPMISDELKDMEREFPAHWLEEAMGIAVQANKRNLRYVRGVLERWQNEGRSPIADASEEEGARYVSGRYADFIDR